MKVISGLKKGMAVVLSAIMIFGLVSVMPGNPDTVRAASGSGTEPSTTAYVTKKQIMNWDYQDTTGKIVFGKDSNNNNNPLEWYILGKDAGVSDANTAIFAAKPIKNQQFDPSLNNDTYDYEAGTGYGDSKGSKDVYPNHYGASDLRVRLNGMVASDDYTYFTTAEKSLLQATTVTTYDMKNAVSYTTTDTLYALHGADGITLCAGSDNGKALSISTYWNAGARFWLRTPSDYNSQALSATPGGSVSGDYVDIAYGLQPASNLNLSSVIFASAASAASSDTAVSGTITSGKAMTLRLDGTDKNIGTASYYTGTGDIEVTKGSTTQAVALVVQGNDGTNDWYYSKKIAASDTINAADIKSSLGLSSDIDLSVCKIWLEITDTDGLIYSVQAVEGKTVTLDLANGPIFIFSNGYSQGDDIGDFIITEFTGKYIITGSMTSTDTPLTLDSYGQAEFDITFDNAHLLANGKGAVELYVVRDMTVNITNKGATEISTDGLPAFRIQDNIYSANVTVNITETKGSSLYIGPRDDESQGSNKVYSENITCTINGVTPDNTKVYKSGEYAKTEISSVAITDIVQPTAAADLSTTAKCENAQVSTSAPTVTWTPTSTSGKAEYYTAYTASVTLSPADEYRFTSDTAATVNGNAATSVTKNDDGTLTVTYTFPTTAKPKLRYIIPPSPLEFENGTLPAIIFYNVPAKVEIVTEAGTFKAAVEWEAETFINIYDPSELEEHDYYLEGNVTCPDSIDPGELALVTSIKIKINEAETVEAPTAQVGAGEYTSDQSVVLTSATPGATIYYTIDGTEPSFDVGGNASGTTAKYSEAISVTGTQGKSVSTTIKAVAIKSGMYNSQTATFEYTITIPHTHGFEDAEWKKDKESHWHECNVENCDKSDGYITGNGKHEFKYTYIWSNDNKTCTATRKCSVCEYTDSETANSISQVTQTQTCEKPELTTYTATFKNASGNGFATQTKKDINTAKATGHKFSEWKSNGDGTHSKTCQNNGCSYKVDENCSGGSATYFNKAVCGVCKKAYGTTAADSTAPTGEISVSTNKWNTLLNTITFGKFFKATQEVTITGTDDSYAADGFDSTEHSVLIHYLLVSGDNVKAYTTNELNEAYEALEFNIYENTFSINPDNKYVVYARIEDYAGNVTYISSDGVVLDATAPSISGLTDNAIYCNSAEFTVTDTNLDKVTDTTGEATTTLEASGGKYILSLGTHKITAIDKAGNSTSVSVTIGAHSDANKDHKCDYGCNVAIGEHSDANKDHKCDYGCSVTIGAHSDANKDHKCDYGCNVAIGDHSDANKDHKCDYGCNEAIGEHSDANKDHKCDYGCSVTIGEHSDANKDHKCDYGCAVAIGEHSDANKDHNCDYGCNVTIGAHSDENKDHKCDYGCDVAIGAHSDANKDHKCDYGCSVTIGAHSDENKDHNCDYGCNVAIGAHADEDKDHNCDYCGEKISEHTGGKASCTSGAICEICENEYGTKNLQNHTNLKNLDRKEATAAEEGNIEYWYCDGCEKYFSDENAENEIELKDTVIAKLAPMIIKGSGQTVTEGEKTALEVTSDAAFTDFIRVEVDGKTVDEGNYTIKSGSTIVTLNDDYIATLSAGEHTLGVVSQSGTATTKFTVNKKAAETTTPAANGSTKSPKTGDNSNMFLWLALLFVSGGAVTAATIANKKRKYNR